jgi:dTDP-4-dehydrorhamnose reductase
MKFRGFNEKEWLRISRTLSDRRACICVRIPNRIGHTAGFGANSVIFAMKIPDDWKILVTGITSIHGWPIYRRLSCILTKSNLFGIRPPQTDMPTGPNVSAVCIKDRDRLHRIRKHFNPTHIVHCAGVCDLDVCEDRPDWAHAMNVDGTRIVSEVFGDLPILYMSTDLVFSGDDPPDGGYAECHKADPVSVAGKTFSEAEAFLNTEDCHCIVRLGLPLGDSVMGNKGAIDWIESRFKRKLPVTLFHDEFRSCVSCDAIADMAVQVLSGEWTGLYHFGGPRSWSLHDIGAHVIQRGGYDPSLLNGILRHQEVNGPPRIGDVSLNSQRYKDRISNQHLNP